MYGLEAKASSGQVVARPSWDGVLAFEYQVRRHAARNGGRASARGDSLDLPPFMDILSREPSAQVNRGFTHLVVEWVLSSIIASDAGHEATQAHAERCAGFLEDPELKGWLIDQGRTPARGNGEL